MANEDIMRPTDADVRRLWEVNPEARIQLHNIMLSRQLAEAEHRIKELENQLAMAKPEEDSDHV